MNKYLFVAFALFAVIGSVFCDSSEELLEEVKSKHLKHYLSQNKDHVDGALQKLEEKCPGVSDKLKEAIKSFKACDDKVDTSLTICASIQQYTLNCTKPLLKVVNDCLPQKAKGLPILGVKSLVSVADFLCKQTGESIFELANPCLWEDNEETGDDQECENKVKDIASKYKDEDHVPTTEEICTSATSLRSCIQTHAGHSCTNQKTKDVAIGLYDAIVAPCSHLNEI